MLNLSERNNWDLKILDISQLLNGLLTRLHSFNFFFIWNNPFTNWYYRWDEQEYSAEINIPHLFWSLFILKLQENHGNNSQCIDWLVFDVNFSNISAVSLLVVGVHLMLKINQGYMNIHSAVSLCVPTVYSQ